MALLDADWPAEILESVHASVSTMEDPLTDNNSSTSSTGNKVLLYRGLRVRMGIHTGTPLHQLDPVTGRMDYFGQMVNRAARVAGIAQGGQILCKCLSSGTTCTQYTYIYI